MPFLSSIQLQETCDGYILKYPVTVSKVILNIYTICSPYTENKSHTESTSFSLSPCCKRTGRNRQRTKNEDLFEFN